MKIQVFLYCIILSQKDKLDCHITSIQPPPSFI